MVTTEQKVQRVVIDFLEEDELVNLNSHLLRHQDMGEDTKVDVSKLICNSKESAEAISTMMQHCQSVNVQNALFVDVDIGTEGWEALGKALSWKDVDWIDSYKACMDSARREDLKDIWEGAAFGWEVWLDKKRSQVFQDWNQFEKCLDGVESGVPINTFGSEEDENENQDEDENENNEEDENENQDEDRDEDDV